MRRFVIVMALLLGFAAQAHGERVTLQNTETLVVPTSARLDWYVSRIDATAKTLHVTYRWLDSNLNPIRQDRSGETWKIWVCQDRPPQLVASCTALHEPYPCCTGPGAGTGCDPGNTCFTDVFGFVVRSQDVGTKIGVGLRALIWTKFKADVLSTGNTGTFDVN